jgi:hypothetical protein
MAVAPSKLRKAKAMLHLRARKSVKTMRLKREVPGFMA